MCRATRWQCSQTLQPGCSLFSCWASFYLTSPSLDIFCLVLCIYLFFYTLAKQKRSLQMWRTILRLDRYFTEDYHPWYASVFTQEWTRQHHTHIKVFSVLTYARLLSSNDSIKFSFRFPRVRFSDWNESMKDQYWAILSLRSRFPPAKHNLLIWNLAWKLSPAISPHKGK